MTVEAVEKSLGSLHIHGDDGTNSKEGEGPAGLKLDKASKRSEESNVKATSDAETSVSPTRVEPPPILICDAWYGFPKQNRPRRERINAVSRQISNFLEWRSSEGSGAKQECHVSLLGSDGDVQAVRARMRELDDKANSSQHWNDKEKLSFQCNANIHEFLYLQKANDIDEVVYLSPDASQTLSATSSPPRIVIIGMLIDRRITADRSRLRAEETLKLRAVKLPLDELNVKELTSREPLNVDTVMELMQRWWWNCDRTKQHHGNTAENDKAQSSMYRKCFLDAAAWSMKSQRERHPNRTVHLSIKE
mmetsp:Transcript_57822/g.122630  ORF Transcript_57822/g.122630 Transcript_57822/m.122630 type:complete len:306 (-) Transcript_57822:965-1882(-)